MRQWFVGCTKDQQELKAAAELRQQGYGVYLPKVHTRHQEGRKVEARTKLRFTGYIFIAFDLALDQHGPISNTRGMDGADGSALILSGGKPQALPPGIIETLRSIEDEELARATARSKPAPRKDLIPGDLVVIDGDRTHPAFGRRGHLLGVERMVASVLEGIYVWKVPEVDLKKVEPKKEAA